mgnify:CR=1 FL=1
MKSYSTSKRGERATICFKGLNLTGGLMALSALKSGLKVAVVLEEPLCWDYEPEIVAFYPIQFRNVLLAKKKTHFFERISSLFPALVYPQRILTVSRETKVHSKTINLIDSVLRKERDISSLPIAFEKYTDFQILNVPFGKGILVQELRFDRYKAIIDLLMMCRKAGALILSDLSAAKEQNYSFIKCLPYHQDLNVLRIDNFRLGFKNNIRIINPSFEIISQFLDGHTNFHFRLNKNVDVAVFVSQVFTALKSIGVEEPDRFKNDILGIYENLQKGNEKSDIPMICDSDIWDLEKSCLKSDRLLFKLIGEKVKFRSTLKSLKSNKFDGYNFRMMQAGCDEKFDLAKQTGIEYIKFCYYFYRYNSVIDEFIVKAYEKVNQDRTNPERIWKEIEQDFILRTEAEIV